MSFESSSSPLPNQLLSDVAPTPFEPPPPPLFSAFFSRDVSLELDVSFVLAVELRRKKPSMAWPIMCASTTGLLWSHFSFPVPPPPLLLLLPPAFDSDRHSDLFLFCGSLRSLSLNRPNMSFENEAAADLLLLSACCFVAIGWWRFVNHPDRIAVFSSAAVSSCLAFVSTDPSKLFDRLVLESPFLRGSLSSGDFEGTTFGVAPVLGVLACGAEEEGEEEEAEADGPPLVVGPCGASSESEVMSLVVGVGISSYSLISVAEEVSVDRSPRRSVFVQTIPAFSLRPNVAMVEVPGTEGDTSEGISEARRCDLSVCRGPTKSEYLRFVYRIGDPLASFSSSVCTSHTFSLLVFQSFMRAFRACTMSSIMSSCRLWMLPRASVDGGPVRLSLRLFVCWRAAAPRLQGDRDRLINGRVHLMNNRSTHLLLVLG